ncbi:MULTISPECIES: type II toxin-antitoxin system RelE/ParE family toxin [Enterobacterales]|jgi:plasmid stabilization system protein ParE|uniref:type II toxin-antitoxin system RelE/ParE family toxin n=1 Tax=Enterobacterales TaxID=91347 RepID=UPI0004532052|nr:MULTISPECIES: type II toxin-antitoxin system RelE/ParE family toxin [Enterobacterales]ETX68743.1 hypothetical protein P834_08430 [Citrobacter freundii UCI 31]MCV1326421.1 type II toxin-antitoxin system RelE/ParE family toxin [Escherichia coli]MDE8815948.1 type II toxin-antitoxin system RelE/ParE family toxin [Citrobacter freundii]MDF7582072.1 type II toxin-antitoxin system RelE/ParE family toxin [Escherichia coli]MDF7591290.1 type II toxin-antitoxin system RelE/ParE family toxin [Escherichi
MPQQIWTRSALADVQRFYRFLTAKDIDAAKRAARAIRSDVKILTHQPYFGDQPKKWNLSTGNG